MTAVRTFTARSADPRPVGRGARGELDVTELERVGPAELRAHHRVDGEPDQLELAAPDDRDRLEQRPPALRAPDRAAEQADEGLLGAPSDPRAQRVAAARHLCS